MDFNFAHFANFNFPHFKIGEIFGLIWVKIQNGQLHLQILFQVFKRCLFQLWALFLLILCKIFGQILDKTYRMIH